MLDWLRSITRWGGKHTVLHDPEHFQAMLEGERLRANRTGSLFSLLTLGPPKCLRHDDVLRAISVLLRKRLRATDVTGLLQDHRIGVLLPDTVAAGARELLHDLAQALKAKEITIEGEIVGYPNQFTPEFAHLVVEQDDVRQGEIDLIPCHVLPTQPNTPPRS